MNIILIETSGPATETSGSSRASTDSSTATSAPSRLMTFA